MPVVVVIPALIAYIKVVAVKTLVVELWAGVGDGDLRKRDAVPAPSKWRGDSRRGRVTVC